MIYWFLAMNTSMSTFEGLGDDLSLADYIHGDD